MLSCLALNNNAVVIGVITRLLKYSLFEKVGSVDAVIFSHGCLYYSRGTDISNAYSDALDRATNLPFVIIIRWGQESR